MQYNPNPENVQSQPNPAAFQGTDIHRVSTNTADKEFDLISVLYHALEGAQTYAQYAEDAGREGDKELSQFFIQAQQNQVTCAEQAKQLLSRRLSQTPMH
ncbi:MAG TPA: hypothetical protein VGM01_13885 [Ktedonobacteraceae bacterium]